MLNQEDRLNLALGLIRTAYNDYIAARVLLNRNYTLQGVILSSTAIEKYFKALIVFHSGKIKPAHFDKFDQIKKAVEEIGYNVLIEKMDPRFIEILTKVYPLRYYDNIKSPTSIGFFKNQFLGELDQAIFWFDKTLIPSDDKGTVLSPVIRDFRNKNPDLLENNWVAQNPVDKKRFMEINCEGFAIYIHPRNLFSEINVSSVKLTIPYDGTMHLINVN
ncbi:HEPN domain-containing protein [Chitinophaga sancti]|uniref:HEPN domain-containing protein n=1 Tax=Chitinophaga sancti TaxID=1004 RepID=A0A1K1SUM4_9BACT|nr:HEPN domain-containing protein [Chitinophaga sancti]WQD63794.1 HEPN domain-containing protein [Chitinophaga sancti]WQG90581.1 HEPN domain-containing protein [Chitinophaga sancti]SFW88112.1 HEPN domain-containing protein [Chitinophaga sancti]